MAKIKGKQERGFRAIFGGLEISHLEGTIIASFFPEPKEMTIKEIQKRTDYSYERVNTALKSLVEKGIVQEKKIGKTLVYSLDLKNIYSDSIGFNAYMLQKEVEFIKKHRNVYKAIKEIKENPYILGVILFGSYSKGTENKESDVDLIVTCIPSKKKEVNNFIRSLEHKYGINFSPVVLPVHEFSDIKRDNPELWNDLKMYGIVFKGGDAFYYWMYRNENS